MTNSLEDLMADLGMSSAASETKETKTVEPEVVEEKVEQEVTKPADAPKKPRGRPRKVKEEVPAVVEETKESDTTFLDALVVGSEDIPPMPKPANIKVEVTNITSVPETTVAPSVVELTEVDKVAASTSEPIDIYILKDSQIIDGNIYHRGQKITFVKGDKFYQSQTDRFGKNWLDIVDDVEAQYAYFGRQIVEAHKWSGIPMGSLDGIEHPGLALAINNFAREELERNGKPFN